MFIASVEIKNLRCFAEETTEGFRVPDGSPGSGLNILLGENGTGKTTVLEAIHWLDESAFAIQHRVGSTDFGDIEKPIEIVATADKPFGCKRPWPVTASFAAQGLRCEIKARQREAPNRLLSDPYTIGHEYEVADADRAGLGRDVQRDRSEAQEGDINIVYFDKNRSRHLTRGTYRTMFERICDELNWRFVRELAKDQTTRDALEASLEGDLFSLVDKTAGAGYGRRTAEQVSELLGDNRYQGLRLDLINYLNPFDSARFAVRNEGSLKQVMPRSLGSGVEVLIALVLLENLADGEGHDLVYLIDEPEAHLHPKAQESLVQLLIDEAAVKQVFLATHSPFIFRSAMRNGAGIFRFERTGDSVQVTAAHGVEQSIFDWGPTWAEINYRVYDLPSTDFHNELYGYVQELIGSGDTTAVDEYLADLGVARDRQWIRVDGGKTHPPRAVTLSTYVRHSIHHPENTMNSAPSDEELRGSIETLITAAERLPVH